MNKWRTVEKPLPYTVVECDCDHKRLARLENGMASLNPAGGNISGFPSCASGREGGWAEVIDTVRKQLDLWEK